MAEKQIVQVRKRKGLDKIMVGKGQGRLIPELYHQEYRDRSSDGTPEGVYRGGMILDAKQWFAPHWDDLNGKWAWGGTNTELDELVKKMKLKYPEGHNREGTVITSSHAKASERLVDFYDPVFRHPRFYGRHFMQESRGNLDLSDPFQKFIYLCYKGDPATNDKTSEKLESKFIAANKKFDIVSPRQEDKKRVKVALKEIDATKLVATIYSDEDKIRAICEVMDLPQYRPTAEKDAAWMLLKEISQNTSTSVKYGRKSYQDRFIELAKMEDKELNMTHQVVSARRKGLIRKYKDHYLFDGDKIYLGNDYALVKHFLDPSHQELLIKLMAQLEE